MSKTETPVDLTDVERVVREADSQKSSDDYFLWSLRAVEMLKDMADELSGLRAARMAYANEFPLNDEGEPDVGSIHENIRKLKTENAALRSEAPVKALLELREFIETSPDSYFGIGSCKVEGSFDRNYMVKDNLLCIIDMAFERESYDWIPVTERMPEDGEPVEVLASGRGAMACGWTRPAHFGASRLWAICAPESDAEITHWRKSRPYPYTGPAND